MRISDWSSDVCSSDLKRRVDEGNIAAEQLGRVFRIRRHGGFVGIVRPQCDTSLIGEEYVELGRYRRGPLRDARQSARHRDRARRVIDAPVVCVNISRRRAHAEDPAWREDRLDFETLDRSEEHTSELQSLMRLSYAV